MFLDAKVTGMATGRLRCPTLGANGRHLGSQVAAHGAGLRQFGQPLDTLQLHILTQMHVRTNPGMCCGLSPFQTFVVSNCGRPKPGDG